MDTKIKSSIRNTEQTMQKTGRLIWKVVESNDKKNKKDGQKQEEKKKHNKHSNLYKIWKIIVTKLRNYHEET
jgi:hypothetical protein